MKLKTGHSTSDLLKDDPACALAFNRPALTADLVAIEKMLEMVNALCDVFIERPEINKWTSDKVSEHTKKINNLFLL